MLKTLPALWSFALLFPLHVFAAEGPFDAAAQAAGGFARYQRVETVSYDFQYFDASSTAPVRSGRRVIRLHDGAGLRAREDSDGAGGPRTVVIASTGGWSRGAGLAAGDPAWADALRAEVYLDRLPHVLKEEGRSIRRLPMGRLRGLLMSRWAVEGPPPFPGCEGFIVYAARDTGRIEGLSCGEPARFAAFSDFQENKSLLVFPARRAWLDGEGRRLSAVVLKNVIVNGLVDESLFQETAP